MFAKFRPRLNASIKLAPTGSHVVILGLIAIFGICLVVTFFFAWFGVSFWLPLIVAGVLLIVIVIFWFCSYQNIDAQSIPPVSISISDRTGSTALSMHHKSIPDLEKIGAIERLLSAIQHRSPLPDPDGLIDHEGEPIPESQKEARARVQTANTEAKEIFDSIPTSPPSRNSFEEIPQLKLNYDPDPNEIAKVNKLDDKSSD